MLRCKHHNHPPKMKVKDIISITLNNKSIRTFYEFTSPKSRHHIGSYKQFKSMVQHEFQPLIHNLSWTFVDPLKIVNHKAYQNVSIQTHNLTYIYQFILSKQYDYKKNQPLYDPVTQICLNRYWRIDSIKQTDIEHFESDLNIDNTPLEICSLNPLTGFYRDGYCKTGKKDYGTHTVCAKVTKPFLDFTKQRGNDLSTPQPPHFPGLQDGDHWCLCANRYKEAKKNGYPLQVKRKATHSKTNDIITRV